MTSFFNTLGLVSSIVLPFFNIPLMVRIYKRKSADDISLVWAFGIWFSLLGMLPSSLLAQDLVLKAFTFVNLGIFSMVLIQVLYFKFWKK